MKASHSQKKFNNSKNIQRFNPFLLNLAKYKLYPAPDSSFSEIPKLNPYLNLSTLQPIRFNDKKAIIGDGSFSKVFLYNHKKTRTKYAIKKMNISLVLKKSGNKNIILNEINIQSKITHPNIIRLYNYFKDKENLNYYLILEFASKGTLFDYIHLKKGFNESNAFYYFIQAVNAIYFLHNNQIIHRDLKPENLLINHENILKLCDFGWSVYLHNNKRETFCGTVEYMAPEIVKNQGYDFSIDVWSLGVLLYELIHSHSPFVVKDLDINKIENNIVSKGLKFKKGVTSECKDLIRLLLAKNVENRIKVQDIYQHPFVLRYVNMINNYFKINNINYKITNKNNINNEKSKNNQKLNDNFNILKKENINNNDNKESILNDSQQTFKDFESIPDEPEPKKINGNFDKIVRKFNKIENNTFQDDEKNIFQSIKTLIDKNIIEKTSHKKSLSLNNIFADNININNNKNTLNKNEKEFKDNNNKEIIQIEKNSENYTIKEDNTKSNVKNQDSIPYFQNTLIKTYNNNLIKTNYKNKNKNNKILRILNSETKTTNISQCKKPQTLNNNESSNIKSDKIIIPYKVKKKNKNKDSDSVNKKILINHTTTNIHNLSKLNKTGNKIKIPNCKKIASIKFNKTKSFHNFSLYSNTNTNFNNNQNNNKNKLIKKRNVFIKNVGNLNKDSNFSFNCINKINSDNNQKKLTLNLSNINVINVYNNANSNEINSNYFNVPKIIQKINTFFIREKPKNNFVIDKRKNVINSNNSSNNQSKKEIKKNPSYIKIKKSRENLYNSEKKRKNSKDYNTKRDLSGFKSCSNIKKSKNKSKIKSNINIKIKTNSIPVLNLGFKKK